MLPVANESRATKIKTANDFDLMFDILIVGDEPFQESVKPCLAHSDYTLRTAAAAAKNAALVDQKSPDLVLMQFEASAPLHLLEEWAERNPSLATVMLARAASTEAVVKCMQLGVRDFLRYPEDLRKLAELVEQIAAQKLPASNGNVPAHDAPQNGLHSIIGECAAMQQVKSKVAKLAKLKAVTVLILGETGTGKEVVARALHNASTALSHEGNFIELNCTAIPEHLLEAELFGYEKGAFTDAKARKLGLFELAEGGSLFLDEIGDMSLSLQAKMLKAIEEKKFRRLGGLADIKVNTRIITGTNANLKQAVSTGLFRQDLYYRLNVLNLELPPLRERGDDIPLLARHFLRQYSRAYETPATTFTAEAETTLIHYPWPGNVRELKHAVERAVLLSDEMEIDAATLRSALGLERPAPIAPPLPLRSDHFTESANNIYIDIPTEGMSLKEGEQRLIKEVLKLTKWNRTKAAEILGISRPRLKRKIDEYHIAF